MLHLWWVTEYLPYRQHLYQFPFSLLAKHRASSNLKKEGLISAHSLRGQSTVVRKARGQAWEAAGHICMQSVGREERSSLKMWFGVDGVRQSWYGSNQTEGHQLMFSVALRLDTWIASGCRTDAGLEAPGRGFSKRSAGRGLRRAPWTHSPCARFFLPGGYQLRFLPVTPLGAHFGFLSSAVHPVTSFVVWAQHLLPGSLKIQAFIFKICFLVVTVNTE